MIATLALASSHTESNIPEPQTCHQPDNSRAQALVGPESVNSLKAPLGCHWDGTAPFCSGECKRPKYVPVKADKCGDGHCCWTGKKVLCCLKGRRRPPTKPKPRLPPPKKTPHHGQERFDENEGDKDAQEVDEDEVDDDDDEEEKEGVSAWDVFTEKLAQAL